MHENVFLLQAVCYWLLTMNWARAHPYASASLAAGVFLVFGVFIVAYHATAPVSASPQAWGGAGVLLLNQTSYTPNPVLSAIQSPAFSIQQSPVFLSLAPAPSSGAEGAASTDFDMSVFLATLSGSSASGAASNNVNLNTAYAFIPRGLVATTTFAPQRTAGQQALYEYGNEVGSYIQSYENQHRDVAQVLRDQIEDRQNAAKAQGVRDIGTALQNVGRSLGNMEIVPDSVAPLHRTLATSYGEIGQKLAGVPDAQGDQAFIAAIEAYNATADTFIRNYVALATFFSVSGVTFSPQDAGSVFSFSVSSGL